VPIDSVSPFAGLQNISFANVDVTALTNAIVSGFQTAWTAQTGEQLVLGPADRRYHFLLSLTGFFVAAFEQIDQAAKQNLLPFAEGGFLQALAAIYGSRANILPASAAVVPITFTLGTTQSSVSTIPLGTQVSATDGSGLIFATTAIGSIPIGQLSVTINAACTTIGAAGNGIPTGAITQIQGFSPTFAITASNPQASGGGADIEDSSPGGAYAQRIFDVTDSFSNAGSYGAYKFFAESADPSILQASVSGPETGLVTPGQVLITVLCQGGSFPNSALLTKVFNTVSPNNIRPLTDQVFVQAPSGVPFSVNVSYYIPTANANNVPNIQASISTAVAGFISTVQTNLDWNIDPSVLTQEMVDSGAIRVVVTQPTFLNLAKNQVGVPASGTPTLTYLGLD
jgi:phage-related baseplate assembly protein